MQVKLLLPVWGICVGGATLAWADDDVPKSPASAPTTLPSVSSKEAPSDDGSRLEEIIVTAQKRQESLQKVPISALSIGGEQVSFFRGSGADIRLLSARIPSLTVESSFGRTFPRFYIRGLGNTDFDLNASQPVSMVLDDVVLENPTLKGFPLFDVDRVEVLRGPQGTLFGRNTPAGVIKFQSKAPTFDFEAFGRTTYGSFNFIGVEGAVSGPVIDDILAARVSFLYERRDGWVDNTFTGENNALEGFDDVAGRLQLLFTPNERSRLLLNLHAHNLNGTARLFRANIVQPGTDNLVEDFRRDEVSIDGVNEQTVEQLGFTANLQHDFGEITLTSIFGYESAEVFSLGDIDGGFGASFAPPSGPGVIPFPSETSDGIPALRQYSFEVRLASNDWKIFNFQAGVFRFREDLEIELLSYDTLRNSVINGRATQDQITDAFAVFGSVTIDILKNLRVGGGVRWSDDRRNFQAERLLSPIGAGTLASIRARPEATFVSWDANLTYGLTEGINLYGRIARGYRAPSIQGRVLFSNRISVADQERMISYEAGAKAELFDRRARINLAGFYYELSDQQLTAVGGGTNTNTLLNSDKARGVGFELESQIAPTSNVLFTFGLSYNDTEIQDDDLAVVPCGGGCTVLDEAGTVPGTVLIDGNPLPHAPKWIFNTTLRVGHPINDDGELFLFADLAYRSRVNFFLYESAEFTDPHLVELGLRLGYSRYDGRLEFALFSRNLNNDLSRTGGIDFNNLTGFVNEPQTFGADLRLAF